MTRVKREGEGKGENDDGKEKKKTRKCARKEEKTGKINNSKEKGRGRSENK